MRFPFLLLVALLPACSSKDGHVGSSKFKTVQGFCAEWGKAACNAKVVGACSGLDVTDELTDACISTQADYCESLIPGGKYSSTTAKECIAAVGATDPQVITE